MITIEVCDSEKVIYFILPFPMPAVNLENIFISVINVSFVVNSHFTSGHFFRILFYAGETPQTAKDVIVWK